tara:strand:- start:145 stop:879 length:735 start_codon:yes stop_codon:yes gene_type:complete
MNCLIAMPIQETGIWIGKNMQTKHRHDDRLSKAIVSFFKNEDCKEVVDFGCGMGMYVKDINDSDIKCEGYDGNPATHEITDGTCDVIDLSKDFYLGKKFDWVISLEVGEHLPPKYEDIYINNLHKHTSKGIIMSWAVPRQGGDGYVNERDNSYIRSKFEALGYESNMEAEKILRKSSSLWWFKKTVFVFRKRQDEIDKDEIDKDEIDKQIDLEQLNIDRSTQTEEFNQYPCNFCPNCGFNLRAS